MREQSGMARSSASLACVAGFCSVEGCGTTPVDCDDGNVCTDDSCDSGSGCFSLPTANPPEPSEVSCEDGVDNDCDGAVDAADSDCWYCGDGIVQAGVQTPGAFGPEECDDANTNGLDGCDRCIIVDTSQD